MVKKYVLKANQYHLIPTNLASNALYLLARALYLNNCVRYFSLAPKLLDYRGEFFEEPLSRRYITQDNALNECIKYGFSVNILALCCKLCK